MATTPTPITGLTRSEVSVTDILHFTGGLRAVRGDGGWQLGPLLRDGTISAARGIPEDQIRGLGQTMGLVLFGADEMVPVDPHLPARIWTPLLGPPRLRHAANDTWAMISSTARDAGDEGYAKLARNLSVSLRAAGLQLRNASDEYGRQLEAALAGGRRVGGRFTNLPMVELHLAFHSVLSEMASARDYLAQVAARRVGAPDRIDALARFRDWTGRPANSAALNDALVTPLFEASDVATPDPWLFDIGEYRNLFLHREHIGAMARWLVVEERDGPLGPVRTIAMAINTRPGSETTCDALTRFVDLYGRLCRLAEFAAPLAAFEAKPPAFGTAEIPRLKP